MRRLFLSFGMAFVVAVALLAQPAQKAGEQTARVEDEILKLAREWLEAEARGDLAALDRIFADDFIGTGFGGNVLGKQDVIPRGDPGQNRMPKASLKETTVRMFGDTGVAMGRVAGDDPSQPGEFRFTMVFIKRNAGWQVVAAHLSR